MHRGQPRLHRSPYRRVHQLRLVFGPGLAKPRRHFVVWLLRQDGQRIGQHIERDHASAEAGIKAVDERQLFGRCELVQALKQSSPALGGQAPAVVAGTSGIGQQGLGAATQRDRGVRLGQQMADLLALVAA